MTVIAAHLYATACGLVVLFQLALIAGAPWGRFARGGRQPGRLSPLGRVLAGLSAVLLLGMALAILAAAGIGPGWPRWTGWGAFALSGLSVLLNTVTPSAAERGLWGPVTMVMAALALVVMTG